MKKIRLILFPFSFIYGIIIYFRNVLYNLGVFKSVGFDIPIISVGNLCLGGSGKTPHIEFLINILKENNKIAVLSRGYKRKTKGFISAEEAQTFEDIGDEPFQIKKKFRDIKVVVCENRVWGVKKIMELYPETDVILLDDAFQHRKIKAGLSVLITDYFHPFSKDHLLPVGNLREPRSQAKRADIIIVSKTHKVFSPILARETIREINPKNNQSVFFSYLKYSIPIAFPTTHIDFEEKKTEAVLIVTGIANPYPLIEKLQDFPCKIFHLSFPDHHEYEEKDILKIKENYHNIAKRNKIILTTEKDYVRLLKPEFANLIKELPMYYIRVEVGFHKNFGQEELKQKIYDYVGKNKTNH